MTNLSDGWTSNKEASLEGSLRKEIMVPTLCPPFSHYADAVLCGNFLFVSGVTACDEHSIVVGQGDTVAQAEKAFESLGEILRAAGFAPADVVKVTIYLTNVDDRAAINPIRQKFFGSTRPASTLVQVSALVLPEMKIEVEAVAYRGELGSLPTG